MTFEKFLNEAPLITHSNDFESSDPKSLYRSYKNEKVIKKFDYEDYEYNIYRDKETMIVTLNDEGVLYSNFRFITVEGKKFFSNMLVKKNGIDSFETLDILHGILEEYGAILSDNEQTPAGKKMWQNLVKSAKRKNAKFGYAIKEDGKWKKQQVTENPSKWFESDEYDNIYKNRNTRLYLEK